MERFARAACVAAATLLSACSGGHGADAVQAISRISTRASAVIRPAATAALFQPRHGILPYPTDLYFAGSTDGTLNIQPDSSLTPSQAAVNSLDGFSTTAAIRARFSRPLDPRSFTARSVTVLQVSIDNTTKAVTGVVRPLVFGVDFTTGLGAETGVGHTLLEIRPTHPLVASTSSINSGYLVVLTNSLKDSNGNAVTADTDFRTVKAALPGCSTIADTPLRGICQLTGPQLEAARTVGINPAEVVLSFSFSTQSTADTLRAVERLAIPQPLLLHNTGLSTAQMDPRLSGHATIYVGTLSVPYYLSRAAPLTGFWQGSPSSLDESSRLLTRFNPMPVATETLRIPVLVTVPNANSAVGAAKPANGWPVVIFQHGINRSRADALNIADSFADSGLVVVAIDLPLHGVTDPTSQLYASATNPLYSGLSLPPLGSIERTFDLDLVNNTTGTAGADGEIDSSGASFLNLTSLLTTRDNLRQGAADLITLTRSLPAMSLGSGSAGDIDPAGIHFLGHSLGAVVGTLFLAVASNTEIRTGVLAMPGGGIPYMLRDSASLGPRMVTALQAQGLTRGSALFEQFFRDAQTVVDSGDPLNYIAAAAANHPIHVFQVVGSLTSPPDQVIPNSATERLIDAAGLTRIAAASSPGSNVSDPNGLRSYVNFIVGDHGSLVDPTASMAVTTEMQAESITFTGASVPPIPPLSFPGFPATPAGSTVLLLLNSGVIQP